MKPLEQDDWEDRVTWDTVIESTAKPSQASPELPSFPRTDTFFIPSANVKKPKKPKFIEPEPLSKNIKKGNNEISMKIPYILVGLWGEVTSSSSTPTMPTKSHDDIFDEVLESLPLEQNTKSNNNNNTSASTSSSTVNGSNSSSSTSSSTVFKNINAELLQGDWRKCILWDDTTPPEKPFPTQLLLDLNDPSVFPEDISKYFFLSLLSNFI